MSVHSEDYYNALKEKPDACQKVFNEATHDIFPAFHSLSEFLDAPDTQISIKESLEKIYDAAKNICEQDNGCGRNTVDHVMNRLLTKAAQPE